MSKGCAIVTGSSRGIGEAIVYRLAQDGYDVVVNYVKSEEKAKKVAKKIEDECKVKALVVGGDVSKYEDCKNIIDAAMEKFGRIDVLVNNAGIHMNSALDKMSVEDMHRLIQGDLMSEIYCCSLVIPHMAKGDSGRIINLTSDVGIKGYADTSVYAAAKAGVIGLTKSLAKELGQYNITVNGVAPGMTFTDMFQGADQNLIEELKAQMPLGRLGKPENIANCVSYLVNDDFINGQILSPNGGTTI